MGRTGNEDLRVRGLALPARFTLAMSLALVVVMTAAGFFYFRTSRGIVNLSLDHAFREAARLQTDLVAEQEAQLRLELTPKIRAEIEPRLRKWITEDVQAEMGIGEEPAPLPANLGVEKLATRDPVYVRDPNRHGVSDGRTERHDVRLAKGERKGEPGFLYEHDGAKVLVPAQRSEDGSGQLLGLVLAVSATVVLAAFAVAYWIALQVSKPLEGIVEDVRQISRGDLEHRTRVRGGGEVALLSRAINRMAGSLREAQNAELELSVREREREVAQEVREALLPAKTPSLPGYQLADMHIGCLEPGGDFHDYILADGRVVLLVCDVSGTGVPGALVGSTARAYLRNELERSGELEAVLEKVNRDLARDVRRGMYVTALCVVVDPASNTATLACAGHKIPLIRYRAADAKVFLAQPEGIALGFDKGPVFDRSLEIQKLQIEPGDRLVLANTGPVRVQNQAGEELGEKGFYRAVKQAASETPEDMLTSLRTSLEAYAGDEPFPADISTIILARDA